MNASESGQITQLLVDWAKGDQSALERLIPLVNDELRRLAHRYIRGERTGHTLQTSCHGDPTLRDEVELLLSYDESAKSFIEETAIKVVARQMAEDRASQLVLWKYYCKIYGTESRRYSSIHSLRL